ncbi:MAG: hypothetical protein FD127_1893 [Acidimicrobiaceae bacterium]|nr:MAG: hypothetical protein FD127_1893 [Acidimicrobiaceae bacterium]
MVALFGTDAPAALDLLELLELAWHDCYGEITPAHNVVADVLVLSEGTLSGRVLACRLAVTDWRDLHVAADHIRAHP